MLREYRIQHLYSHYSVMELNYSITSSNDVKSTQPWLGLQTLIHKKGMYRVKKGMQLKQKMHNEELHHFYSTSNIIMVIYKVKFI
jgi:hypothetical protein